MLHRISTASTRRPWLVIGLWVVLLLGGALVGQMKLYDVTTSDTGGFLPSSYESARATAFGEKHFGVVKGATAVTALVKRDDGRPLTPADQARVATLTGRMAAWRPDWNAIPHSFGLTGDEQAARALKTVAGPTFGAGRFQLVGLQFRGNSTDPTVQKAFKQFRGSTVHAFAGGRAQGRVHGRHRQPDRLHRLDTRHDAARGRPASGRHRAAHAGGLPRRALDRRAAPDGRPRRRWCERRRGARGAGLRLPPRQQHADPDRDRPGRDRDRLLPVHDVPLPRAAPAGRERS